MCVVCSYLLQSSGLGDSSVRELYADGVGFPIYQALCKYQLINRIFSPIGSPGIPSLNATKNFEIEASDIAWIGKVELCNIQINLLELSLAPIVSISV